jgi:hypothetical protein
MIDSLERPGPKKLIVFYLTVPEYDEIQEIADQIRVSKARVARAFYDGYFEEFVKKLKENKKIK